MNNSLEKAKPRNKAWRYLLGYIPLIIGQTLIRINIKGRHNIPSQGPYIVVANHFSTSDPFFFLGAILKPISFLMASDQNVELHLAWAPKLYGYIPTDRKNLKPGTIKQAVKALKNGEIIGLFPEGDTLSNVLRPAKRGAAYLSTTSEVKILPMAITGVEDMWKHLFRGVRPIINVNIGKPFMPEKISKDEDKKVALDKSGHVIMKAIANLLPEEKKGAYKN